MKELYDESFIIRASESGANGVSRPDAIAGLLQEVAGNHADQLNFDILDLQGQNITWILHQLQLKMHRYPAWREKITIETWPSSGDKLRAYRDFRILDQQGNELGVALSYWLIMNLKTQRPQRIPREILDYRLEAEEHVLPLSDKKLSVELTDPDSKSFGVRRTDMDVNRHVNNVAYIRWMLESVPEKRYLESRCSELNIQYTSQARLNENIQSLCEKNPEPSTFSHQIRKDGKILAHGISTWK